MIAFIKLIIFSATVPVHFFIGFEIVPIGILKSLYLRVISYEPNQPATKSQNHAL